MANKKDVPPISTKKDEVKKKVLSGIKRDVILFNLVDEGYKEDEIIKLLQIVNEELSKKNYMGVYEITISCFLFMIGFLSHMAFPISWLTGVIVEICLFLLIYWVTKSPAFESKIPNKYWTALYCGRFIAGIGTVVYYWRFAN